MSGIVPMLVLLACARAPVWTSERAIAPARAALDLDADGRVTAAEYGRVAFSAPDYAVVDLDHDGDLSVSELDELVDDADPKHFFEVTDIKKPPMKRKKLHKKNKLANEARAIEEGRAREPVDPPMPMGMGPPSSLIPGVAGPQRGGGPSAASGEEVSILLGPEPAPGPLRAPPEGDVLRPVGVTANPPESYFVLLVLRDEILSVDPAAVVPGVEELRDVGWKGSLVTPEARALLGRLELASTRVGVAFPGVLRGEASGRPASPVAVPGAAR
ncbi:MAG: hypothetical protein EXR69_00540 [Myxococcales bacterium]|nr:hypothetical protein [Myxococcales bacterium]